MFLIIYIVYSIHKMPLVRKKWYELSHDCIGV